MPASPLLDNVLALTRACLPPVHALLETATARVKSQGDIEHQQSSAHGLAWLATYVQALTRMHNWAEALEEISEIEALILQIGFGEYLWQIYGGIPMSQGEIIRLQDIGLTQDEQRVLMAPAVMALCQDGNTEAARSRLAVLMCQRSGAVMFGASGLSDELDMIRDQFRRFSIERVLPHAHDWHRADALIPEDIIAAMADMGVFGLTIPEEFGGLGLSKASMCVVSEELSRGYIGVGSAQLVRHLSQSAMLLIIGGPVTLFAILQLIGWQPKLARQSRKTEAIVAAFAGFIGGLSAVWGPPTVAYLTAINTPKSEQMRVQGVIYGLGALALFGAHIQSGVIRAQTVPLSLLLVIPALMGMWIGLQISDRIDQQTFRKATLFVLLFAGLNLLRRALLG